MKVLKKQLSGTLKSIPRKLYKKNARYTSVNSNFQQTKSYTTLDKFFKNNILFDVVIMNDVIEHLDNPFKALNLIEKNLEPKGILIFTTFNMDSIVPKIMGYKYHWIMPMHKFYLEEICRTLQFFFKQKRARTPPIAIVRESKLDPLSGRILE